MSRRIRSILSLAVLAAASSALAGSVSPREESARRLQPFADREAGRYLDAADLASAPAPRAGSARARRWEDARRDGLDALIVRPDAVRGAYRDFGAVHAAWGESPTR